MKTLPWTVHVYQIPLLALSRSAWMPGDLAEPAQESGLGSATAIRTESSCLLCAIQRGNLTQHIEKCPVISWL